MKMEIKKIRICNISSYVGENVIDLSTRKGQNVVLIGGNNGSGKTSLFTAIKLALYGPQCFRFQDKNNQYTARIKELINHDAYTKKDVEAFVEIELLMPTERSCSLYTLHRSWNYTGKKLYENYNVYQDGMLLGDKDIDFFQNYLFTLIPPNLFDFFLFDGEEIAEFFSTGNYNNYIKNAVLTLCGYDTFQVIKRFCDSYVGLENGNEMHRITAEKVVLLEKRIHELEEEIVQLETTIPEISKRLVDLQNEENALRAKFETAGGLDKDIRDELNRQMHQQDILRSNHAKKIRDFVEDLMPVFITKELAAIAQSQLIKERKVNQYQTVLQQLSEDVFYQVLCELPKIEQVAHPKQLASILSDKIAVQLKPEYELDGYKPIHDLSQEQEERVTSVFIQLQNFDSRTMIEICQNKTKASEKYDMLSKQLREALPEVDANSFFTSIKNIASEIFQYENTRESADNRLEIAKRELEEAENQLKNQRKDLLRLAKDQTAYIYTERISQVMNSMIQDATHAKFKQVEQLTLEMFHKIIRKNDFIELIELDDNFNINIYKKQVYTARELALLLQNVGGDELSRRLGISGIEQALEHFGLDSVQKLKHFLTQQLTGKQMSVMDGEKVLLYKHMELNQLSKGEKQVFILALYWAIIKTSGQSIPFIIDTPYARIDTEHREQIAKLFFPDISEQVIILSTDEEMVGRYQKILEPYIAQKYLLDYDTDKSQTVLTPSYFSEVSA